MQAGLSDFHCIVPLSEPAGPNLPAEVGGLLAAAYYSCIPDY